MLSGYHRDVLARELLFRYGDRHVSRAVISKSVIPRKLLTHEGNYSLGYPAVLPDR